MLKTLLLCVAWLLLMLALLLAGPAYMLASGEIRLDRAWHATERGPAGLAPDPATTTEAVVQVYAARAFNWRGLFAVHTWIAVKQQDAPAYTRYEVTRWRPASIPARRDAPDRAWFGNPPKLLAELRGETASAAILAIEQALPDYPFRESYQAWPGPNSNTFTAWLVRRIPELRVEFPPTAIGKDYLHPGVLAGATSGSGFQIALGGLLGLTIARDEGLEVNILGLVVGVDPLRPAVKIPGVGRLGTGTIPMAGDRDFNSAESALD